MKKMIFLLLLLCINQIHAQDVSHLKQMPNSNEINRIKGNNEIETLQKQLASLSILKQTIYNLSGKRRFLIKNGLTIEEKKIIESYDEKAIEIRKEASKRRLALNERKILDLEFDKNLQLATYSLMGEIPVEKIKKYNDSINNKIKTQEIKSRKENDLVKQQLNKLKERQNKDIFLFSIYTIVLFIVIYILYQFYRKCNKCKRANAMRIKSITIIDQRNTTLRQDVTNRDYWGRYFTNTYYFSGKLNTYEKICKCKYCGFEEIKIVQKAVKD